MSAFEGMPKSKHIAETSPAYEEHKVGGQEILLLRQEAAQIFGEHTLSNIDFHRTQIEKIDTLMAADPTETVWEKAKKNQTNEIRLTINAERKRLMGSSSKGESSFGFETFCDEMANDLEIWEILGKKVVLQHGQTKSQALANLLSLKEISDEEFEKMLRRHVENFKKEREAFDEHELPEILSTFKEQVDKAIQEGYLPITRELFESRISEVTIVLADVVESKFGELNGQGDYDAHVGIVRVASNLSSEARKGTIFHELVHVLAGRTILKTNSSPTKPDGDTTSDIQHQRLGLGFSMLNEKGRQTSEDLFRWLDEAVTEDIGVHLESGENSAEGTYVRERKLLKSLCDGGVPRELVYKAYFENYIPEVSTGSNVPAWKELVEKIGEVYPESGGGIAKLKEIEKIDAIEKEK